MDQEFQSLTNYETEYDPCYTCSLKGTKGKYNQKIILTV